MELRKCDIHAWPEMQALLPPLSRAQREALAESIRRHGVQYPAKVLPDGRILDGANRWEVTGGDCPFDVVAGRSDEDAKALGLALNLARRQLSQEQLKEVHEALRKVHALRRKTALELRKEGLSQQEAAARVGVDQSTVSAWEADGQPGGGSIMDFHNTSPPAPDCRVHIPKTEYETIAARCDGGESQAEVAADYQVSRRRIGQVVNTARKWRAEQGARDRAAAAGESLELSGGHAIWHGDFRDRLAEVPDGSVSLILTDPPYDEASLPLYEDVAAEAARVLKPGGSLIAYAGNHALPQILSRMSAHLRYWWTLGLLHSGSSARLQFKCVLVEWKPLVWFVRDDRGNKAYVTDLVRSERPDKVLHHWQQGTKEAEYLIGRLTAAGDLVLDPMCGSATTCVAAARLGRRSLGIESDKQRASAARKRVADVLAEKPRRPGSARGRRSS